MALRFLSSFLNHEKNLNQLSSRSLYLERVDDVLSKLGSVQKSLKVIHIAGSKGKGSTAAFVAQILKRAGYKVGLYTSPHLYHPRERFRILDNQARRKTLKKNEIFDDCISPNEFYRLIKKIRPALEAGRHHPVFGDLTYFEVLTIAAFCYFDEQKVDFAVLETGLGGRLDATNVCKPLVAAITPISLEHTKQLGNTLSQIAFEKAGIIKKGAWVVLAPQAPEALAVIKKRCDQFQITPVIVGKNRFKGALLGEHQNVNAALAVGVIEVLRKKKVVISKQDIKCGLAETFWPARFEIISRSPWVVLDGAHNPASCQCLAETLFKNFPNKKRVLVFGSSSDKDIQGMADCLAAFFETVILTRAAHPRAVVWTPKRAKEIFASQKVIVTSSVKEACNEALQRVSADGLIVVTGSLFVAAEARKIFSKIPVKENL